MGAKCNARFRVFGIAILIAILVALGFRLWIYPLDVILCKEKIGSVQLQNQHSCVDVAFTVPKGGIHAISFALPALLCDTDLRSLSLHVLIANSDSGSAILDEAVSSERMQWTNWHESKSFSLDVLLTECLYAGHRYDLNVKVLTPGMCICTADVYLHWLDLRYLWGRERQGIHLTVNGSEEPQGSKSHKGHVSTFDKKD